MNYYEDGGFAKKLLGLLIAGAAIALIGFIIQGFKGCI